MDIIELVNKSGSSMEMVYFYEQIQLIESVWKNNQHVYSEQDCGNVRFIERMVLFGLSPQELQLIFEIKRTNKSTSLKKVVQLTEKLSKMRTKLLCEEDSLKVQRLEVEGLLEVLKYVKRRSDKQIGNVRVNQLQPRVLCEASDPGSKWDEHFGLAPICLDNNKTLK